MSKASPEYEIVTRLGKGAFANVVLMKERRTGEMCALKQMSMEQPQTAQQYRREKAFFDKGLVHPNIVGFIGHTISAANYQLIGLFFLEYCEKGELLSDSPYARI